MTCKYWREYDDDNGCYEFCRADNRKTYCCGAESQCLNNKFSSEKEYENYGVETEETDLT